MGYRITNLGLFENFFLFILFMILGIVVMGVLTAVGAAVGNFPFPTNPLDWFCMGIVYLLLSGLISGMIIFGLD